MTNETTTSERKALNRREISGSVSNALLSSFYDADGITIYNARCEQVLPFLDPVDLMLTDPPYGLGMADAGWWNDGDKRGHGKASPTKHKRADWDNVQPSAWLIGQAIAKGTNAIVWGGNHFDLGASPGMLVWDKDNTGNFADCELAWTNLPKAVRKIKWRWNGMLQENGGDKKEPRLHPTQKPLAVMKWSISQAPDTVQTVLDPFMGVGTTLVAAKLMGKRAIGIEVSTEYCERAVERLRQGVLPFAG